MRIAIFGRNINPVFYDSLRRLFGILHLHHVEVTVYRPFLEYIRTEIGYDPENISDFSIYHELRNIDFFFSIGGDGTFLEAISLVRDSGIPMVGINSGRLGFLADIAQTELESALENLFTEKYHLQPRSLIRLENDLGLFSDFPFALNEFTVHKRDTAQMITIPSSIQWCFECFTINNQGISPVSFFLIPNFVIHNYASCNFRFLMFFSISPVITSYNAFLAFFMKGSFSNIRSTSVPYTSVFPMIARMSLVSLSLR